MAERNRLGTNSSITAASTTYSRATTRRSLQALSEYAYEAIRAGILTSRWRPGDPLSEHQLAEELKISRTPVRQALQHLEREGFVVVLPSRGTYVAELSLDDVRDVYELREVLEGQVARWAAERRGDADLAELESIVNDAFSLIEHIQATSGSPEAQEVLKKLHNLGNAFHIVLSRMAGNRRAADALRQLDDHALRVRLFHGTLRNPQVVWAEHALVLEYVRAGDAERAEEEMRRHLRNAYECVVKAATKRN